jgi:hypothetical protein
MKLRAPYLQAVAVSFALALSVAGCTSQWGCRVDTNQSDFEVLILPGVLVTSSVNGSVYPFVGEEWLPSNEPTFKIWRHPTGEATELRLGIEGHLSVSMPPGRYCFRASAHGFTAAVGRIEIRESAPARSIEVRLPIAN